MGRVLLFSRRHTVLPVTEESPRDRSDTVIRLFFLAVTAKYVRRYKSGVACSVTSTQNTITLESLPKPGNEFLGEFLRYFQLGTPQSRRLIILPRKKSSKCVLCVQYLSVYCTERLIKRLRTILLLCLNSLYIPLLHSRHCVVLSVSSGGFLQFAYDS
ncbi:hypothetical protein TNCV_3776191 [Trichonephila clavipes]|nr:hypothetical protein TNCV_3776191 [Trichonephila clavipes]